MGNRIDIGNNNSLKETNIAGNDINNSKPDKDNKILAWFLKHLDAIITAIISGAVSAFVSWIITYSCLK